MKDVLQAGRIPRGDALRTLVSLRPSPSPSQAWLWASSFLQFHPCAAQALAYPLSTLVRASGLLWMDRTRRRQEFLSRDALERQYMCNRQNLVVKGMKTTRVCGSHEKSTYTEHWHICLIATASFRPCTKPWYRWPVRGYPLASSAFR